MMKPSISGLLPDEIAEYLSIRPSFRGNQIFEWIHRGITDFDRMTNLPLELKTHLKDTHVMTSEISRQELSNDGTLKITIKLQDNRFIESVLLVDEKGRKTACLSSQAGCAMGCTFCKTADMGLHRNLTSGEIVEQLLLLQEQTGKISNVVFMGMGEPMANFDEVIKAIKILHHPLGQNLGHRRITISTSGVTKKIKELADTGLPVKLAVSLITADDAIRAELMPVAGKESLKTLKGSILYYQAKIKKRITLEYVLLAGINDRRQDVHKLRRFCENLMCVINIIPWNPAEGLPYSEPSPREVDTFISMLEDSGLTVTKRYRKGQSINGACGQLAVLEDGSDPSHSS